jgi:hypothetical protein
MSLGKLGTKELTTELSFSEEFILLLFYFPHQLKDPQGDPFLSQEYRLLQQTKEWRNNRAGGEQG